MKPSFNKYKNKIKEKKQKNDTQQLTSNNAVSNPIANNGENSQIISGYFLNEKLCKMFSIKGKYGIIVLLGKGGFYQWEQKHY